MIDIVGGSIGVECKTSSLLGSQIVSETDAFDNPAIETISPASASSKSTFLIPLNA